MLGSGPLASGPIAASSAKSMTLDAGRFNLIGYTDAAGDTRSLALDAGGFAFVGSALRYGEAYTMVAAMGSYGLTLFKPFTPLRRIFVEASVTYALTGQPAITRRNRVSQSTSATYTLTGSPAGTGMNPAPMTAAKGVFKLSGFATASTARSLVEPPGVISFNGASCSMMVYGGLPVAPGQFLFAFPRVAMIRTRTMTQAPGVFSVTCAMVGRMSATGGQGTPTPFVLTGQPIVLSVTRSLSPASGAFVARGSSILAIEQAIPQMPIVAGLFVVRHSNISLARQLVLVQTSATFEVIAHDTSFGYDDDEIVKERIASMICTVASARTPTRRARPNPVNGMLLGVGCFGLTPAMVGIGRTMALQSGDLALTGAVA